MYIDKAWSVTGFLTARETEKKGVTDFKNVLMK